MHGLTDRDGCCAVEYGEWGMGLRYKYCKMGGPAVLD